MGISKDYNLQDRMISSHISQDNCVNVLCPFQKRGPKQKHHIIETWLYPELKSLGEFCNSKDCCRCITSSWQSLQNIYINYIHSTRKISLWHFYIAAEMQDLLLGLQNHPSKCPEHCNRVTRCPRYECWSFRLFF